MNFTGQDLETSYELLETIKSAAATLSAFKSYTPEYRLLLLGYVYGRNNGISDSVLWRWLQKEHFKENP